VVIKESGVKGDFITMKSESKKNNTNCLGLTEVVAGEKGLP